MKYFDIDFVKNYLYIIVGIYDFSGFSLNKEYKLLIKIIYSFDCKEIKIYYIFSIYGNSFLRYMVCIIMGNVIVVVINKKF